MKQYMYILLVAFGCMFHVSCFEYRLGVKKTDQIWALASSERPPVDFELKVKGIAPKYKKLHLSQPSRKGYSLSELALKGYGSPGDWEGDQLIGEGNALYWKHFEAIFDVAVDQAHLDQHEVYIIPSWINGDPMIREEAHHLILIKNGVTVSIQDMSAPYGWYANINTDYGSLYFEYDVRVHGNRAIGVKSDDYYEEHKYDVPHYTTRPRHIIGGLSEAEFIEKIRPKSNDGKSGD